MLFTSKIKLENKFSKGESMRHEILSDGVYAPDRTQVPVKNCEKQWARSIQPKFPEISVQNSMDRFGPTGKVSKKPFEVDQFSRSDRLEFWLNGSRPVKPPRPQAYCFNKK